MKIGLNLNPGLVERKVEFKLKDGETIEDMDVAIKTASMEDIFIQPTKCEGWLHKLAVKLFQWCVRIGNHVLARTSPRTRAWFSFHIYLKMWVLHPTLKLFRYLFRNHLVTEFDKIPAKPWNNLIRMWRYNKHEAILDIWRYWNYNQHVKNGKFDSVSYTRDEFIQKQVIDTQTRPYIARKTFMDFETTMVLQDTADRARVECELMRNCHTMMEYYGVPEEYRKLVPTQKKYLFYLAGTGKDIEFFVRHRHVKTWQPKPEVIRDEKQESKKGEFESERETKTVQGSNKPTQKD